MEFVQAHIPGHNAFMLLLLLLLSHFSHVRLLATPWTAAYQASLPMGFSRQEYWLLLLSHFSRVDSV